MKIVPGLRNYRTAPVRSAAAAVPTRTEPVGATADTVELGPWKPLQEQGWLENARGALGGLLSPALCTALGGCLTRLDQAGVRFSLNRLKLFEHNSDSSTQTLAYLKKRPPEDLKLKATLPGGQSMKVDNLKALMALDLVQAGGATAPDRRTGAEAAAFRALAKEGWQFIPKQGEVVGAAEAFYRAGEERMSVHVKAPGEKFVNLLYQRSDAIHLDYMMGDGVDYGMVDPKLAAGLKAMDEHGFQLGVLSGGWYSDSPFDAYRSTPLKVADPEKFLVRKGAVEPYGDPFREGAGAMPITARRAAELASEGKLEEEFASFEKALQEKGSELTDVQLLCALRNLHGAQLKVAWGPIIAGIRDLSKLAPRFETTPNDLGQYSAVLFKDCESEEEVGYRLAELSKLAQKQGPSEFPLAVKKAATYKLRYRKSIEDMRDTKLSPEIVFGADTVQIGDQVLER